VKHDFWFYNNDLAWLCWEAAANASLPSNSLISGKIQGIWLESGRRAALDASLRKGLRVEFPTTRNRERSDANRERSLSNRDRPRLSMRILVKHHQLILVRQIRARCPARERPRRRVGCSLAGTSPRGAPSTLH